MRVVVDTNVFVSAILCSSPTMTRCIDAARTGENVLLIPEYVLGELHEKARSAKFGNRPELVDAFLADRPFELIPESICKPCADLFISDAADLPVLTAARAARADVIVTGDRRFHAPETRTGGIRTINPAEFLGER